MDGFDGFHDGYDADFDTSVHEVCGCSLIGKQEDRSGDAATDDDWSSIKMVRSSSDYEISTLKGLLPQQRSSGENLGLRFGNAFFSDTQSQMLCFSSSTKAEDISMEKSSQMPSSHRDPSSPVYGYNGGCMNNGSNFASLRCPFTKFQWMELEKQALMYKYIIANIPIPSNLLNPLKKPLESVSFPPFPATTLRSSTLGWEGSFHLGMPHSNDPEPGRCRRTDGKKWRCSRDAVSDQKYCDRHINRGRHRSRKPVETLTSPYSTTKNITTTMPLPHSSTTLLTTFHNSNPPNPSAPTQLDRIYQNKDNDEYNGGGDLSMKSKQNQFPISELDLLHLSQHWIHPFMDNWPRNQTDCIGMQTSHTNHSIDSLIFNPQSSSMVDNKITLSPLKLAWEIDPIQMGLGVGNVDQNQGNWGPLGEVLHGRN